VLMSETGKSRGDATLEPVTIADAINYWAGHAEEFLADQHPKAHSPLFKVKKLTTVYRPYPLVGMIEPWNFPLAMLALDLVPALAAGAAVLLKPSEVTPLSAVELARGWDEIGAPPVFGLATGYGDTGAAVIEASDYVHFTGSTATGRKVAVACAQRLIPFSLELGGKDPAIVFADADLDRAANGIAWGGMFNSGQVCISVERVFVEAPVYNEFVAKLADKVRAVAQGQESGPEMTYDTGAMATEAQRDIVDRHVSEATAAGAKVLVGGKPTGVGTFFEPTVLADVDPGMSCMAEETFGPTLPVVKVADEDEAVRQRQRRDDQRLLPVAADGRLEGLRHRLPRRRRRGADQVLPPAGHHRPATAHPALRDALVLLAQEAEPLRAVGDAGVRRARLAPAGPQGLAGPQGPAYPGGLALSTQRSTPSSDPGTQSYTDRSVTPEASRTSSQSRLCPVYSRAGRLSTA